MRRHFFLLLLILGGASATQAWLTIDQREGDQRANALVRDPDGSLTYAGRETRPGTWRGDLLLVHTDSLGRELWRRSVGTKRGDEEAYALLSLGGAGYLAAGCCYRSGKRSRNSITGLVQAFSTGGEPTWSREFDHVEIKAAVRFQDGILLGGCRKGRTDSGWLCRMDGQGVVRWTRDLHPADSSRVDALAALSDSTFVLAGQWKSAADPHCAAWCAVADVSGNIHHESRCGSPNGFFRAVVTQGGDLVCGGGVFTPKSVYNNDYDSFVWQADLQCRPLDSLRVKGKGLDYVMALAATDSTIAGTGVTTLDPAMPDSRPGVLLHLLTSDLRTRWKSPLSGIAAGMGKALALTSDGFVVAGLAHLDRKADSDALLLHATAGGLVESGGMDPGPTPDEKP